jgi:hypothetical protein
MLTVTVTAGHLPNGVPGWDVIVNGDVMCTVKSVSDLRLLGTMLVRAADKLEPASPGGRA